MYSTFLYSFTLGIMKERISGQTVKILLSHKERKLFHYYKNPMFYFFFNFTNGFNSKGLLIRCSFAKHTGMISGCSVQHGRVKVIIWNWDKCLMWLLESQRARPKRLMCPSGDHFWCGHTKSAWDHLLGEAMEEDGGSLQYVNQVSFWPCESWITSQPQFC